MARSDNDGKLTGTIHIPLDKLPLSPAAMASNPPKHLLLTGHAIPDVYQSLVDIKAAASVVLIPPTGISVITDIDDTIKITGIADGKIIAAQKSMTALQEAVAGMANRYIKWYEEDSAAFHYVSAGHRGLYTALLADFLRDNGFPPGSVHLQEGSVINGAMGERSKGYKIQVITRILEDFPQRHFILVGDNGQKDMEVYEEIYRKYPHQVKKILIRDAKQLEPVAPLGTEQQVRRALQSVSTNSSLQTLANVSRAAMASPTPSFSRGLTRINTASSSSTPSTPPNGSILSVATVVGIDGEPLVRLFNDGNQLLHMDIKIFTSSTTTTLTTANHVPFKLNHGSSGSNNNGSGDTWSPPVANLIDF
ncbi:hypothetical protein GQ42DRAFT_152863 [Ramicandelaber brevisporus]|nr:hypothetical protein GQ42DRAFT_152863 [Ramicandelaber brevisporus]